MKITDQDTVNTISYSRAAAVYGSTSTGSGAASGSGNAGATSADGIDLANQSGLVSQAQTAGSDSRAAYIEQLRAQYQSGQYQVDPVALSKSLIQAAFAGD